MKEDWLLIQKQGVLIVAKCNVNIKKEDISEEQFKVLIVAKCNVNIENLSVSFFIISVLIVAKCNVNMVDQIK